MYAKSLSIYDFRCFGKAALNLQYPGRRGNQASELANVNLILGDNGGGKSSVLRALAIAVLAPALLESGFVPQRLVRRPGAKASLLKVQAMLEPLELEGKGAPKKRADIELLARIDIREKGGRDRLHLDSTPASPILESLHDDLSPAFFMVGYGATRRVETGDFSESSARRSRGLRYQRVAGLFEDHLALRPLRSWLQRLPAERATAAAALIDKALPDNIRFAGTFDDTEEQYVFDFEGRETPFNSLSDGYKAFIGMVADLVGHLTDVQPPKVPIDQIPGIVLVDEIDLHLHPSWQRSVIPSLAAAFPRLQFLFTSHSPLAASSVRHQNVFVTDVSADGTATIKQIEEKVWGRSIEQLLLSSYFGLQTTRPDSFQDEAQKLFTAAAGGDRQAALSYLDRLIEPARPSQPKAAARARRTPAKATARQKPKTVAKKAL